MIFTVKGKDFDTKVINGENPYIIDNNTKEKPKNEKNILKAFLDKEMPDYDKVKYHSTHQLIRLVEGILRDRIVYSEDDIIKLNHFIESLPDKQIDNPSDTFAHVFRHEEKENFISDWLAYLLNPEKTGTKEVLKSFFNIAGIEVDFSFTDFSIEREYDLEGNGRIDIFIETESFIVGIENKINSGFTSKDQLAKYYESITNKASEKDKPAYLFLLFPEKNTNFKVNEKNKFNYITYEKLIKEFKKIDIEPIKYLRSLILMKDFILHIEEYIMDVQKNISIDVFKFLDDKRADIENLNNLQVSARRQFIKLIEQKFEKIIGEMAGEGETELWKQHITSGAVFFQIYKTNWEQYNIHFELVSGEGFPPKQLYIDLHHESKNKKKETEQVLFDVKNWIKKEHGSNKFIIDYTTIDSFDNTIDDIMKFFKKFIEIFAPKIDKAINY